MTEKNWLMKFLSSDYSESMKRLVLITLTAVFVIQFFLLMYIKVPIANTGLVDKNIWYLVVLIGLFGGFISAEMIANFFTKKAELTAAVDTTKAKTGTPDTTVKVSNVENVNAENLTMSQEKQAPN